MNPIKIFTVFFLALSFVGCASLDQQSANRSIASLGRSIRPQILKPLKPVEIDWVRLEISVLPSHLSACDFKSNSKKTAQTCKIKIADVDSSQIGILLSEENQFNFTVEDTEYKVHFEPSRVIVQSMEGSGAMAALKLQEHMSEFMTNMRTVMYYIPRVAND